MNSRPPKKPQTGKSHAPTKRGVSRKAIPGSQGSAGHVSHPRPTRETEEILAATASRRRPRKQGDYPRQETRRYSQRGFRKHTVPGSGYSNGQNANKTSARRMRKPTLKDKIMRWAVVTIFFVLVIAVVVTLIVMGVKYFVSELKDTKIPSTAASASASASVLPAPSKCAPEKLGVSFTHTGTYADEIQKFDITLRNAEDDSCLLDAGLGHLHVTIKSGDWETADTAHCNAEASRPIIFGPQDSGKFSISWNAKTTNAQCAVAGTQILPGTYVATVMLDKVPLTVEPVRFVIQNRPQPSVIPSAPPAP